MDAEYDDDDDSDPQSQASYASYSSTAAAAVQFANDFKFPLDVESALADWQAYEEKMRRNAKGGVTVKSGLATRGLGRLERVWSGLVKDRHWNGASRLHLEIERCRLSLWQHIGKACTELRSLLPFFSDPDETSAPDVGESRRAPFPQVRHAIPPAQRLPQPAGHLGAPEERGDPKLMV